MHAGQVLARLDPTFAAADLGASAAQVSSLQAQVGAHAGRSGRQAVPLLPASIPTCRCRRRSSPSARPNSTTRWRTTSRRPTASSRPSRAPTRTPPAIATGSRSRSSVEQMRKRVGEAAGRQPAEHPGGDGQPGGDGAQPGQRAGSRPRGAQRDLAAMLAERNSYVQQWHADVADKLSDATSKLSDARESMNKAQLAPPARRAARGPRRHGADHCQGLGRLGAAIGPAIHHAGAVRRAAGGGSQHLGP